MLQTHVNNDIYNKYCLIHNTRKNSYSQCTVASCYARNNKYLSEVEMERELLKSNGKYLGSVFDLCTVVIPRKLLSSSVKFSRLQI